MQISLAQALKEKKRLVGEIAHLWDLVKSENSSLETHTRKIDVKETLQTLEHYTAKLVELKTKISFANRGDHLRNMQLLAQTKRMLEKLAAVSGSEDLEYDRNDKLLERTAVFNEEQLTLMKQKLRREAEALQDKLDAYNARTRIEFETPLP